MRPIITDVAGYDHEPCAKTAEPIEMLLELCTTRVGPRNHVLAGGSRSPWEWQFIFGGKGRPIVKYRDAIA